MHSPFLFIKLKFFMIFVRKALHLVPLHICRWVKIYNFQFLIEFKSISLTYDIIVSHIMFWII